MIKGKGTVRDGQGARPFLLLGIDAQNVTRLAAGEPITFEVGDMGLPPMKVAIFYGDREEDLLKAAAPLLHPDTVIHDQT